MFVLFTALSPITTTVSVIQKIPLELINSSDPIVCGPNKRILGAGVLYNIYTLLRYLNHASLD